MIHSISGTPRGTNTSVMKGRRTSGMIESVVICLAACQLQLEKDRSLEKSVSGTGVKIESRTKERDGRRRQRLMLDCSRKPSQLLLALPVAMWPSNLHFGGHGHGESIM